VALQDKSIIITGGGSGIGRAMVQQFHREGANVIAADINDAALTSLAAEIPDVVTVRGDISTPEDAQHIIDTAEGRIDILCNNAGVSDGTLLVDETSIADWQRCIAVNLTGAFLMSRLAIPIMIARGGGSIINTASVAGLRGGRGGAAYVAAKHGLIGLTKNIAATLGREGIRCNAICPGPVDTNIKTLAPRSARGTRTMLADPSRPAEPGSPAMFAYIAVMLARDEAGLVNGAAIPIDSGWTAY